MNSEKSLLTMMASKKLRLIGTEKTLSCMAQEAKINEVKKMLGPIVDKFPVLCSNASILRYLRARNWNTKKAVKMLKGTIKWRLEYRPDKIKWEDIAAEAEQGRLYIADYLDKFSRIVLVMRPGLQSKLATPAMQLKHLVYCMERAMALSTDQEQMVWLIDFQGWNMSKSSVKLTKDAARVLQNCYPERLGLAILYNPPKVFESFWMMVKPFLEPKTYKKVKFVFSNDPQGQKIMEDLVDVDKLEQIFGGKNEKGFDYEAYAKRMKEEDNNANLSNSEIKVPELQQLAGTGGHENLKLSDDDDDNREEEDDNEDDNDEFPNNDNPLSSFEGIIDHKKVDSIISCQEKNNEAEIKMEEAFGSLSEEKRNVPTK